MRSAGSSFGKLEVLAQYPPYGVRAFAYVTATPSALTPAGRGGLVLGDAIVQLGGATHLREVQAELDACAGRPVPVLVVDARGRFIRKHVVPAPWCVAHCGRPRLLASLLALQPRSDRRWLNACVDST
eukprot:6179508-Pleurochrysis_carterae.AAC.2